MERKLRVWWNRNGETTYYDCKDLEDAIILYEKLADIDLRDRSIVFNCGGLEEWSKENKEFQKESGEDIIDGWLEYYDDEGFDISEIINRQVEDEELLFSCPICGEEFSDDLNFASHQCEEN